MGRIVLQANAELSHHHRSRVVHVEYVQREGGKMYDFPLKSDDLLFLPEGILQRAQFHSIQLNQILWDL